MTLSLRKYPLHYITLHYNMYVLCNVCIHVYNNTCINDDDDGDDGDDDDG